MNVRSSSGGGPSPSGSRRVDKVRGGEAWLAVVEGEAGIGKSALIRRVVSSLEDFTVLWAVGDPSETDLPGGVLSQLARRVDRELAARFPLLARPDAAGVSPHALGGQLLLLLGALQESGAGSRSSSTTRTGPIRCPRRCWDSWCAVSGPTGCWC